MTNYITKYLGMPPVTAAHAQGLDNLLWYIHVLMAVLFVGWLAYFLYVIVRFSKARNPKADYQGLKGHASNYVEGLVVVVEFVLLVFFAIPLWASAVDKFPDAKDSLVLDVVGSQFSWRARYPGADKIFGKQDARLVSAENLSGVDAKDPNAKDDFEVVNDIVVPLNKDVIVNVSSMDVIHCFAIKPMRVTQDAIPGLKLATHFKPTVAGTYLINCAQLCGNSHFAMRGTLTVMNQADYDKWAASKATGAGAGAGSYE